MSDTSLEPEEIISDQILFEAPKQELDEPLTSTTSSNGVSTTELEISEKDKARKEKRYFSAFWLIVGCLGFLAIIYFIEVFVSYKLNYEPSSHTSGIIEIIKTLLFTLSGYLFGKKEDSK